MVAPFTAAFCGGHGQLEKACQRESQAERRGNACFRDAEGAFG